MDNQEGTERRVPWQKQLRALADKDSSIYQQLGDSAAPAAPAATPPAAAKHYSFEETVETSALRPVNKSAMSSQVAIPPMLGMNGIGSDMDLLSPDSVGRLGKHFEDVSSNFPKIDTHGGEIVEVTQTEEVDANDGCRVQIFTYRIIMPDGLSELTKTVRRKFQLDCIHSFTRRQFVNGAEVGGELKTTRMQGDIRGFAPIEITNHRLNLDENNPQDQAISAVLAEASNRMQNMFMAEKEKMIALYPKLFKSLKDVTPTKEIIENPDGTITERTKKSFSTHFTKSEVYIDGKKQKSKVRAFVEYEGPEGGFKVKMTNGDEGDLSEDEDDSRSQVSEIPDDESGLFGHSQTKATDPAKKRLEKAWHAAKELVDSEERYVEKLKLLNELFRKRIVAENVIEKDKVVKLFANIESLHTFHNHHLLPQLMMAIREWDTTKRISSIMRKQAPFLKMYSEYTNNYKRSTKLFEECMMKKKRFVEIVREIERDSACENLPLMSHLICPVQRVMRYQLLLQEYKKHLVESDADFADTSAALELVLEAASHANEMMKKLDRYGKVIEVQEQLGNSLSLVHPGRELLQTGTIQKISSSTGKTEERAVFLFNDLVILASERGLPGFSKYKTRAVFSAAHSQVCEGDNLERENSFYIRGSDGTTGQVRTLELFCETQKQKEDWVQAFCQIIDDASHNLPSSTNRMSTYSTSGGERNCAECDEEFSLWSRGYRCSQCTRKLCKKCFGRYRNESKGSRACENCVKNMGAARISAQAGSSRSRQDVLAVPASHSGAGTATVLHASPVKFRGSLGKSFQRYFVIRANFCLYSYNSPTDERALAMLPLPGCEVKMTGEKHTFSLKIGSRRLYMITAEDDNSQAKWMASLDLVANAALNNASSASSDNGSDTSR